MDSKGQSQNGKEGQGSFKAYAKGLGYSKVNKTVIAKAKNSGNPKLVKKAIFAENVMKARRGK